MSILVSAKRLHTSKTHSLGYWQTLSLEEAVCSLENSSALLTTEVLLSIVQKCRERKSLVFAKRLLAFVRNNGLQDHTSLGNHLVPLFVECGGVTDAELIFQSLSYRTEHSWTSLILGHAQAGKLQHAFSLYHNMQQNGIHPSSFTLVALLKSCARVQDLENGHRFHMEVIYKGFERDVFVGSTLIDMYVKCKLIAEAWEVFNNIVKKDVVLWTTLIAGFAEHGPASKALHCLEIMKLENVSPNAFTYSCAIKACGSIGIGIGRGIHLEIVLKGFEKDPFVGKSLVSMYVKCYSLSDAQQVFDKLPLQDIVSWTTLLAGYAELGPAQNAVKLFEQMQLQGVQPDAFAFSSVLKACSSIGALERGQEIHKEIIQEGLEMDSIIGCTLVSTYALCGSLLESQEVFNELPARCVVSWNALIAGFVEHGPVQEALDCVDKMQEEGIFPDAFTWAQILKVVGTMKTIAKGQEVHTETVCRGYDKEEFVGCTLVGMYAKCGLLEEAQEVFDRLQVQEVVSWTALITGYAEHGPADKALNCFDQMQKLGIPVDDFTFACMLKACGSIGAIDKGHLVHQEVLCKGLETDLFVGTSLLDMYSKGGSRTEARLMFNKLSVRDVVSWNALIGGFGNHEGHVAVNCFDEMRNEGVKPDAATFAIVLTACSHASLVHKGQTFLKMMAEEYDLSPRVDHYTCIIDLLARTGKVHEAARYVEIMGSPPSVETWRALLNACKTFGERDLGKRCFQRVAEMHPELAISGVLFADTNGPSYSWKAVMTTDSWNISTEICEDVSARVEGDAVKLKSSTTSACLHSVLNF